MANVWFYSVAEFILNFGLKLGNDSGWATGSALARYPGMRHLAVTRKLNTRAVVHDPHCLIDSQAAGPRLEDSDWAQLLGVS
eukprot:1056549-Rhodomonas_salina.1